MYICRYVCMYIPVYFVNTYLWIEIYSDVYVVCSHVQVFVPMCVNISICASTGDFTCLSFLTSFISHPNIFRVFWSCLFLSLFKLLGSALRRVSWDLRVQSNDTMGARKVHSNTSLVDQIHPLICRRDVDPNGRELMILYRRCSNS